MKLDNEITIYPPAISDNNGTIINPSPLVMSVLDVTYHDSPINRHVFATIRNLPNSITLASGDDYTNLGDYTQQQIEAKLKETLGEDPARTLRNLFPKTLEEFPNGPGTILSGMISSLGIKSTPNCACRRHAIEMNEKGPDWCEANMDTILGWLKTESENRKLPFVEAIARMIVKRAISKSRRLLTVEITANVK
jgi:hypothetical protein